MYGDKKHFSKVWKVTAVINEAKVGCFEKERQISALLSLVTVLLTLKNRK